MLGLPHSSKQRDTCFLSTLSMSSSVMGIGTENTGSPVTLALRPEGKGGKGRGGEEGMRMCACVRVCVRAWVWSLMHNSRHSALVGREKVRLPSSAQTPHCVTKTSPSGVVSAPFRLPQRPLPPTTSEESSATSTTRLISTIRTRTFTSLNLRLKPESVSA